MRPQTVFAGIVAAIAAEGLRRVETERIGVTERSLVLPCWPIELDGFRVLVVSDIHVHPRATGMGRLETRLAALLGRVECDILAVPGDVANTASAAEIAAHVLSNARPALGTFITFGNGEHKRSTETARIAETLRSAGHVLMNECLSVSAGGRKVWLAGVDDPSEDRDRLAHACAAVPPGEPVVLLAHSPEIVTRLHQAPVDLVVCGHTHGGQVCPPNGKALWTQTQTLERSSLGYGVFGPADFRRFTPGNLDRTRMFVSRGVGTAKMAVRAFCRPEIALLTLRAPGRAAVTG
jgi:predicted MPP superfamily phosphohydrolase